MYDQFKPEQPVRFAELIAAARKVIREVSPEELQALQAANPELLIVDVREYSEYEAGHLPNALLVPRGILESAADSQSATHVPKLVAAQQQPIALYCASGGRSALATATLQWLGYTQVMSLAGGFKNWQANDLPVSKQAQY